MHTGKKSNRNQIINQIINSLFRNQIASIVWEPRTKGRGHSQCTKLNHLGHENKINLAGERWGQRDVKIQSGIVLLGLRL